MVSTRAGELNTNSFSNDALGKTSLLRSAAIYGANAAGKSNFIKALQTVQEIVRESAKDFQHEDPLPVSSFKLSDEYSDRPSEFEVLFVSDGVKYQYGFAANEKRITEEWLYAFPKGRAQRWFIRAFDEDEGDYAWDFSSYLLGKKQTWKESTRENSLFLSTAVLLNSEQLKPVYDWFNKTLKIATVNSYWGSYTASICTDEDQKKAVLEFLRSADLDISDIKVDSKKIDSSIFPDDMPDVVKDEILKTLEGKDFYDVKTVHKTDSGKEVYFDFDEESDGTQKIFNFSGAWIDCLKKGLVLFVDELNNNLHPNLVRHLVQLFNKESSNSKNGQLVFTTHETSILDQDVFRRDQIWFCRKDKQQASELYPLTDFMPKKGVENLERAYLAGRYGALPLITDMKFIGD